MSAEASGDIKAIIRYKNSEYLQLRERHEEESVSSGFTKIMHRFLERLQGSSLKRPLIASAEKLNGHSPAVLPLVGN